MTEHPEMLKQIAERALLKARSNVKWFAEVRDTVDGKPVTAIANPEGETFQVEVTSAREKLRALLSGPTDDTRRDP
jgi:hypothetical protein